MRRMNILLFNRFPSFMLSFPFVGRFFLLRFILTTVNESIPPMVIALGLGVVVVVVVKFISTRFTKSSLFKLFPRCSSWFSKNFW